MTLALAIRNRQRKRRVSVRRLRRITEALLTEELDLASAVLGVHLIGARAMTALNWRWLKHKGSTDILTFDENGLDPENAVAARAEETGESAPHCVRRPNPSPEAAGSVRGELFISVDDAVRQAMEFRTSPGLELIRYVVHGILHLMGHDDIAPAALRRMRREENRLVRRLTNRFPTRGLVL